MRRRRPRSRRPAPPKTAWAGARRRPGAVAQLGLGQRGLEELANDAERELALELAGAAHQHARRGRRPASRGSISRRLLPTPAGPSISSVRALAGQRVVELRGQLGQLPLALDEIGPWRGDPLADGHLVRLKPEASSASRRAAARRRRGGQEVPPARRPP